MTRILSRWTPLFILAATVSLSAAEPVERFADGLRAKGYYDTAMDYLDSVAADPLIPAELKKVVPYEKAVTLIGWARRERDPAVQAKRLDQAEALLEQFIRTSPGDSRVAEAQGQRGNIFIGKAQSAIWQFKSASNPQEKADFQKQALDSITKARGIFAKARDAYKAALDKFPPHIPVSQRTLREQRDRVYVNYLRSQLDFAKTTYWEAQSRDPDQERQQYLDLLKKASFEFAAIHEKYRSVVGGLIARVWQGKCFEEMALDKADADAKGGIGRALGIYNEILDHPGGKKGSLKNLQIQALHFRLICYNHPVRKDYMLVEQQASEWIDQNRRYHRTEPGLGIRYQRAISREKLGSQRTLSKEDREKWLRLAQDDAEWVHQYPGQYRDETLFMVNRIKRARGKAVEDPRDFGEAYSLARANVKKFADRRAEIEAATKQKKPAAEIARLQQDFNLFLKDTAGLFELGLKLTKPDKDDPGKVHDARYLLGYTYFLQERYLEGAILCTYASRHVKELNPALAQDAGYIAMAAYVKEYNRQPAAAPKQTEMNWIIESCEFLVSNWPSSERATEAAFTLGQIYDNMKHPLRAAYWYGRIPEASDQYAESQLSTGQAHWAAYLLTTNVAERAKQIDQIRRQSRDSLAKELAAAGKGQAAELMKLDEADLEKQFAEHLTGLAAAAFKTYLDAKIAAWQDAAAKHLATGVGRLARQIPQNGTPSADLIRGKTSLAQIKVNQGRFGEALVLLNGDKNFGKKKPDPKTGPAKALRAIEDISGPPAHSVVKAMEVPEGQARPADPSSIKSGVYAGFVYRLLLRSYVGTQDIDNALKAMDDLEKAAGDDVEQITDIYSALGMQLKDEITRLENTNQTERLEKVQATFREFLNKLSEKMQQQAAPRYSQLIWVAETYYGLGAGIKGDQSSEYFQKAAENYQRMLTLDESTPDFLKEGQELGVKLRLVECKRRQGDWEGAVKTAEEILAKQENLLKAQEEAAKIYEGWGGSGKTEMFLTAITGPPAEAKSKIWGWSKLSRKLQSIIENQQLSTEKDRNYSARYFEARLNVSRNRQNYGLAAGSDALKRERLNAAMSEIESFAMIAGVIDPTWKGKFEELYAEVQTNLGIDEASQKHIKWPEDAKPVAVAAADPGAGSKTEAAKTPAKENKKKAEKKGIGIGGILVWALVLIVGLGGCGWFMYSMMAQQKKRPRMVYASGTAPQLPPQGSSGERRKASSATSGKPRQKRPQSSAGGSEPKRSGGERSSEGKPRRPRPKE